MKSSLRWLRPLLILGGICWFAEYAYTRMESSANARMKQVIRDHEHSLAAKDELLKQQQTQIDAFRAMVKTEQPEPLPQPQPQPEQTTAN